MNLNVFFFVSLEVNPLSASILNYKAVECESTVEYTYNICTLHSLYSCTMALCSMETMRTIFQWQRMSSV